MKGVIFMEIKFSTNVQEIREVMLQAFEEYRNAPAPSSALKETEQSISEELQNGAFALVGYENNVPVAAVRFQYVEDHVHFYRLSVSPMCQGKGYAKKLLHKIEEITVQHGYNKIQCKVRMSVRRNIQLYESIGYQILNEELITRPTGEQFKIVNMFKEVALTKYPL